MRASWLPATTFVRQENATGQPLRLLRADNVPGAGRSVIDGLVQSPALTSGPCCVFVILVAIIALSRQAWSAGPNLDARRFVGHPQGMSCRGHMVALRVRLDEHAHLWVGCPLALPHVRLVVSVEPSGLVISLARSMSSR